MADKLYTKDSIESLLNAGFRKNLKNKVRTGQVIYYNFYNIMSEKIDIKRR